MKKQSDNLAVALDALELGFTPIPIIEGTKIPAVKWKQWQTMLPPSELVRDWFCFDRNIALITTGMVLFDCDDPAKAELVLAECGDTTHKLTTPRGGLHLGYRKRKGVEVLNQVKIKGMPIDIRTDGGLELIPCSRIENREYRWLGELRPVADLPVARIGWTRTRVRPTIRPVERIDDADVMMRRARGYLATIEGAISGQGGHNKTFRVACALIQKFGLSIEQAWPLFIEWNHQCEPPWSEKELLHKLQDAPSQSPFTTRSSQMIQVEFKSVGPGKCRWCKKDKDEVVSLAFSDGSFVGSYCFADFKKALLDKLEHTAPLAKSEPGTMSKPQVLSESKPQVLSESKPVALNTTAK